LGIDDHAHTRTIVNAFRFWIKQFHPDRAVGIPVEVANDRVQRLTQAKEILLERRKARRAA
jgi:DnaJ-class molecular chaperone